MLLGTSIALIAFYAPLDADGLNQKIFYFHVPIALTAYACFGWGAWKGLVHLWKGRPGADLESYVSIHLGVIFAVMTLVTGSIWGRYRWGQWWLWSSKQLVLFLVLFLFYSAYFMLRFSVEPGPRRANLSRRLRDLRRRADPDQLPGDPARERLHPPGRVRHGTGRRCPGSQFLTFCVSLAAMLVALLGAVSPRARGQAHRRAPARAAGADRMTTEEKYVAAAYLVVFVVLLAYVVIMSAKVARLERTLAELVERVKARG